VASDPEIGESHLPPATVLAPPGPPRVGRAASVIGTRFEHDSEIAQSPPGVELEEETRVLLHRRLVILVCACSTASLTLLLIGLAVGPDQTVDVVDGAVLPNAGVAIVGVLCLGLLWGTPSLNYLRCVELFGVASVSMIAGAWRYHVLIHLSTGSSDPRYPSEAIKYATAASNLYVYFLILYYGLLIPNTRRRGSVVVTGMAIVPILATIIAAAVNPGIRASLPILLAVTAVGVAVAGTGAVFGATRINALRQLVFEARREAEQLGPYTLKRLLGEGGMGEVWLAEHRLLKRPCAVKFIRAEMAANPLVALRFEREVRAVTGLTHFNTVRVYDYGRADDGSFYYVMEYLDGPTLDALVKRAGPLAPGRVVYLVRQLCGALAEAHGAGLVHRDIKPSNVIVATLGGQHDVGKVLDFGLVHDIGSTDGRLTQTGAVMGTPAYMCPEQAAGEANIDGRGDLYSLGGVAFFALTGRPPFEGTAAWQLISAHLTKTPPRADEVNPAVPADLADVVARCLAKDPAERFQTATDLDAALGRCGCAADWSVAAAARWWATHETGER
jgi:serine/threonine-protein kinase